MEKAILDGYVQRLKEAEKSERNPIITEMCKEHKLKTGDAWKLVKEAGFDPKKQDAKTPRGDNQDQGNPPENPPKKGNKKEEKTVEITANHKTIYPKYRRAGIVLGRLSETFTVTEEQLEILKNDAWVKVVEK